MRFGGCRRRRGLGEQRGGFDERVAHDCDVIADRVERALALLHLRRGHCPDRAENFAQLVERSYLRADFVQPRHQWSRATAAVEEGRAAKRWASSSRSALRLESSSSPVSVICWLSAAPSSSIQCGSAWRTWAICSTAIESNIPSLSASNSATCWGIDSPLNWGWVSAARIRRPCSIRRRVRSSIMPPKRVKISSSRNCVYSSRKFSASWRSAGGWVLPPTRDTLLPILIAGFCPSWKRRGSSTI